MADFVGQYVCLREIAWRAEALLQFAIETQVDVDLPVARAVERSGGRLGESAGRLDGISEQTINDFAVVFSLNQKQLLTLKDTVLQAGEDEQ